MMSIRRITQALRRVIARELGRACAEVDRRVDEAIGLSEGEIIAATENLVAINTAAREHVADLQRIADGLGGERRIAAAMIEHQTRFCAMAVDLLQRQQALAERAVALTRSISDFVGTIGNISAAARILTINGQIESARLGSKGAAFSVIADQLRDLGAAVQAANESISGLAKDLGEQIPQVVASSALLLRETEAFSADQRDRIAAFQGATDEATRRLGRALAETQDRAARMIARSGEILTHMQFHDRMAQDLREVKGVTSHAQDVLTGVTEALGQLPLEPDAVSLNDRDLDALLAQVRADTPPACYRLSQHIAKREAPRSSIAEREAPRSSIAEREAPRSSIAEREAPRSSPGGASAPPEGLTAAPAGEVLLF